MGNGWLLSCFGSRPLGRAQTAGISFHQMANKVVSEIDFIDAVGQKFETHSLATEGPPNNASAAAPANVTRWGHTSCWPGMRILNLRQTRRITAPTGTVQCSRHLIRQSFMRPLVIVIAHPACGSLLLSRGVFGRWGRHLRFVDSMHLLMSTIVLRSSATRELDPDPQTQPPRRKPRQIQGAIACKGRPMVDSDHFGLSVPGKEPLEVLLNEFMALTQEANVQDIPAEEIADGEWIDPSTIAGAKPTFEIDSPDFVGCLGDRQIGFRHTRTAASPRRMRAD